MKGCLLTLGCLIFIGVSSAIWWGCHARKAKRDFIARVDVLVRETLDSHPRVAPEDDAGPLYKAAWPLFVEPKSESLWDVTKIAGVAPAELEKYLADNAAFLAAMRKAAGKTGYRPPADVSRGMSIPLDNAKGLRNAVRFLAVAARASAGRGNVSEALELIKLALRCARDSGAEGIAITRFVQISCEGIICEGLSGILSDSEPSEAQLREMLDEFDRYLASRPPVHRVWQMEKCVALVTVRDLMVGKGQGQGKGAKSLSEHRSAILSAVSAREACNLEQAMDELIEEGRKPYPEVIKAAEKLEEKYVLKGAGRMALRGRILTSLLMPIAGKAMISEGRGVARLRLMRLGLGCRLYRLRNAAYPAKLSELSSAFPREFGKLPADPFTGKDMKYQRTETGCRLWSVRDDGVDHGGVRRTPKTRDACDIVFELEK